MQVGQAKIAVLDQYLAFRSMTSEVRSAFSAVNRSVVYNH